MQAGLLLISSDVVVFGLGSFAGSAATIFVILGAAIRERRLGGATRPREVGEIRLRSRCGGNRGRRVLILCFCIAEHGKKLVRLRR